MLSEVNAFPPDENNLAFLRKARKMGRNTGDVLHKIAYVLLVAELSTFGIPYLHCRQVQ
jgi:hypothetical protein